MNATRRHRGGRSAAESDPGLRESDSYVQATTDSRPLGSLRTDQINSTITMRPDGQILASRALSADRFGNSISWADR